MATVGEIRKQVQFYLQSTAMSEGQTDIFMLELNSARVKAERFHDFAESLQTTSVSVSPTAGADLATATYQSGHRFKALVDVFLTVGGVSKPLDVVVKHGNTIEKRDQERRRRWSYTEASENLAEIPSRSPRILLEGRYIYLDPAPSAATDVDFKAFTWYPNYTNDDDEDWFTQNGADYLKWTTIVALNHHFQVFVQRQEGSLSPPERAANDALEALVRLDGFTPYLSSTFQP